MFHFLTTIKNDVTGAAKATGKYASRVVNDDKQAAEKVGNFLLPNTEKAINTVGTGVVGATGLDRALIAHVTGNKAAESNAVNDTLSRIDKTTAKKGSGLGGQGDFFGSAKAAVNATPADIAKKSVGAGLGVASEVLPVGHTAEVASKGVKTIKRIAQLSAENASISGGGNVGSQLVNTGKIDPKEAFKAAATGAILAPLADGGTTVAKAAAKGVIDRTIKPVSAHFDPKAIDQQADEVAATHPTVVALNDHLQNLSQHRDQLVKNGAPHTSIVANDNAYKATLKARDEQIKSVKESGFSDGMGNTEGSGTPTKTFMGALTGDKKELQPEPQTFYHGTGASNLTKDSIDSAATRPDGLFGSGFYMTDNKDIAASYGRARGGKEGSVYKVAVNPQKTLDLEKKVPDDAKQAFIDFAHQIDNPFKAPHPGLENTDLRDEVSKMIDKGATGEQLYTKLSDEIRDAVASGDASKNELAQDFSEKLVKAGYDTLTHTGGGRVGKTAHKVMIALDPRDIYGTGVKNPIHSIQITPNGEPQVPAKIAAKEALVPKSDYTSQQLDDLEAGGANLASKQQRSTTQTQKPAEDTPTQPTEPKTGAQVVNEALPKAAQLDSKVVNLLDKTGKIIPQATKAPILDNFKDPQSVASKYLGKTGSDIVYDSSVSAKTKTDLQNAAKPLIEAAEKARDKAAKTTVQKADLEARIHDALENPDKVDTLIHNPAEKKALEATKAFNEHWKQVLIANGRPVRENYASHIALKDAESNVDSLSKGVNQAFSNDVSAGQLKERKNEDATQTLKKTPISSMRAYSSAASKDLAYTGLMKGLPERLKNIDPIHGVNEADLSRGKDFLQQHFKNLLQPDVPTGGFFGEKFQNKLINQSYRSALKGKASFYLQNPTQILAARSQVSPEAIKLLGGKTSRGVNPNNHIDPADLKSLQEGLTSGKSTVSSDLGGNTTASQSKTDVLSEKLSGEQRNVTHAFNLGASQHIVTSDIYKHAIEAGKSAREAAKLAMADPVTRDGATRDGNVLVNTTQFGANIANKPHALSEGGTIGITPLSKKWVQQYKRFQLGTTQLLGNITNPTQARALDIMRRGDPKQTQLVTYLQAAQTLRKGMKDAKVAVKTGAGGDDSPSKDDLVRSQALLDKSIKVLKTQIKNNSSIRAGRTAKNLALMWAASSTIQFLFDGLQKPGKAILYGAPVSPPTKNNNNPLTVTAPSVPVSDYSKLPLGLSPKKLLNFVPIVGPVVNRGTELNNFVSALTGQGK